MSFQLPFQNTLKKNATAALMSAVQDALTAGIAEAKSGVDLDGIKGPDIQQNENSFKKVVHGVTQAITAGGFLPFVTAIQAAVQLLHIDEAKAGLTEAIEGATEIYTYINVVAAKYMPKKALVAEGTLIEADTQSA